MKHILPTEYEMQVTVAEALTMCSAQGWLWTHFPAGEHRHPAVAAKLKAMGLKKGWPDLLLLSPEGVLHALELKRGKAPLKPEQEGFRDACLARGVPWAVARSVDEALRILHDWGAVRLRLRVRMTP